jgi:uncharacterized protein (UPF0264 family)
VQDLSFKFSSTKLLVSVRSLNEAEAALAGGCDWLDVKEPTAGSLGAATPEKISEIAPLASSFLGWSIALGEISEFDESSWAAVLPKFPNLTLVKMGLSQCGHRTDWRNRLLRFKENSPELSIAMVYYADRQSANAPTWEETIEAAVDLNSPVLLIDTFFKNGKTLLDHLTLDQLQAFRTQVHSLNLGLALAGSLQLEQIDILTTQIHPDLVAVRGAACKSGRNSEVCPSRVALLKRIVNRSSD